MYRSYVIFQSWSLRSTIFNICSTKLLLIKLQENASCKITNIIHSFHNSQQIITCKQCTAQCTVHNQSHDVYFVQVLQLLLKKYAWVCFKSYLQGKNGCECGEYFWKMDVIVIGAVNLNNLQSIYECVFWF